MNYRKLLIQVIVSFVAIISITYGRLISFPDAVHSVIPSKYIYCMPFSLRPEQNQPTGSINLGRFNDVVLTLKMNDNNPSLFLYVYATSLNIITIENGVLFTEFTT